MSRSLRAKQGEETVAIAERGWYELPDGRRISIREQLDRSVAGTALYRPDELRALVESLRPDPRPLATQFRVANETTLAAARRMICEEQKVNTLALNFASAKNPGGGFLGGSQAQEESLARSSGLYSTLLAQPGYYAANRSHDSALYTDHLILSPQVPVFRDDEGALLAEPYLLSMITAPAVNAGAVQANSPKLAAKILPTMQSRLAMVLAVAASHRYEHLVLGAWGCGVFRNDPVQVADLFAAALLDDPRFCNRFASVMFAVLDTQPEQRSIRPFLERFAGK